MKLAFKLVDKQEQRFWLGEGSNAIYSTIPKSQELLTINYVIIIIKGVLLGFMFLEDKWCKMITSISTN
jgi:hypothetical protein